MLFLYLSMFETEQERKKMTDIYMEHRLVLLKYALKICGNQETAEDAVHDAFVAIIRQREKYFHLSRRDFRFSAVSIVRNKSIDLLRKQKHFSDTPIEDMEIYLSNDDKPVEELLVLSSEYEAIRKCLDNLDEISKQVLIMKYELCMSYKEIGEKLSMTPKHVDTRIMRAKDKVRKLMKE